MHILKNRHEYGSTKETLKLLKTYNKGAKMIFWESFLIHTYKQQGVLIEEQKVNDFNPIYALDNVTGRYQDHTT